MVSPKRPSSCGEGTSSGKGKGRNPRDWGNLDLDELKIDIEAQRAALEQMNEILRIKKANTAAEVAKAAEADGASQSPIESTLAREQSIQPIHNKKVPMGMSKGFRTDQVCPINQVAPNSFIGKTLSNIQHLSTRNKNLSDDSSSSSSSGGNGPPGRAPSKARGASKSTRQSSVSCSHR